VSMLKAENLAVSVDTAEGRAEVLREISFELEAGKLLGVVGESGAGKSMIGRLVAGMLPPGFAVTAGSLRFEAEDLVALPPRRRQAILGKDITFIPQHPLTSLNPVRTIGGLFDEHLRRLGLAGAAERRDRAIGHLSDVHLPDPGELLGRYPHQLSGGMCQRVLIAMAFAGEPKLIIADEPTTALDVVTQAHIVAVIGEMRARYSTALMFITHDLRLAAQICDEIIVMYAGEIVERGPARAVFARPCHPYTASLELANPSLGGEPRRLLSLPEHMPGLTAYAGLSGCRFAPRCPIKDPACAERRSDLVEIELGRWLRASGRCRGAELGARERVGHATAGRAPERGSPPLIRVSDLGKTYRGRRSLLGGRGGAVDAVRNVSFELHAGEFVGIVGESGSGKSTLARLLMGLETPSAGRIELDGHDVTGPFARHAALRVPAIQMIFQDPQSALNPRRRVGRLVTQPLEAGRSPMPWAERLERAKVLLREAGLPVDVMERYPSQLSGGQRQRVNIARALSTAPKALVADEIVSGLDVSVQAQLLNLLLRIREESDIALLFISHDLAVVRYLCSRVLVMYKGAVVEEGATETVFARPQHPYTKTLLAAVPPDDVAVEWRPSELSQI
jgi:oligopeptide/dipeptide ABC transporter ATP-binding protein